MTSKTSATATRPETSSYELLGTRINVLTHEQAAAMITQRAAGSKSACYIVRPYVEFLDRGHTDATVRQLLNDAWLSLPDSVSTQWATTYLYSGRRTWWRALTLAAAIVLYPKAIRRLVPERFGGPPFPWKLLERCEAEGLSVYLVGSPIQSDISVTARTIRQRLPNLEIAGTWPGRLKGKQGEALRRALQRGAIEQELVADLRTTKPDIILVGISFPLQVELMAKIVPQLRHGVMIGEGGTFDYDSFGGVRRRAPGFLQYIGLEWLWRLMLEPSRWRRQLAIPRFMWAIYQEGRREQSGSTSGRA